MNEVFRRFLPICSKLVKCNSVESVEELRENLEKLDARTLQEIQEYVIFPLQVILKKRCKEQLYIKCIDCMNFIFRNSYVASWNLFFDVFIQLFIFIGKPDTLHSCKLSEELIYSVCKCVSSLVYASKNEILKAVYSTDFAHTLGHSIFVLTVILKSQKSKTLQLAALEALGALTFATKSWHSKKKSLVISAGDRLAAFLPGIMNTLYLLLTNDPKQGQAITVLALNVFTYFISITLSDCYIKDSQRKVTETRTKIPIVYRDITWAKDVADKLEAVFRNISLLVSHDHWKVRFAVGECATQILLNCCKTLENCIPMMLQVVVTLNVDSFEEVALFCQSTVKSFADYVRTTESKHLSLIFKEEILKTSKMIIKAQINSTELETLNLLKMLHGYIYLLGPSISDLLHSSVHLEKIMLCLLTITDFDCTEVKVMYESSVAFDFSLNSLNIWPKKSFRHFQSKEVLTHVYSICQILGSSEDCRLVVDYLIEKLNSFEYKCQSIYLLMCVVNSATKKLNNIDKTNKLCLPVKYEDNIGLVHDILEEFLLPKHLSPETCAEIVFNKPVKRRETFVKNVSDWENEPYFSDNENIVQICLLLEAIAVFSEGLGFDFKSFLTTVLCPVMEKAGSSNLVISHAGKMTLKSIALSCGYLSVRDLIFDNCDYLVNSININLQQCIHKSETAVVLAVALEHCNLDILSIFRDPLQKVLAILDCNPNLRLPLLKVLYSVIISIKHRADADGSNHLTQRNNSQLMPQNRSHNEHLKPMFLRYHQLKCTEMSFLQDFAEETLDKSSSNCPHPPVSECKDSNDNLENPYVELIREILSRCIHFQSSKNLMLCLLSLDVIKAGISALPDDSVQLHPLVNDIWNSFILRFRNDFVIAIKAFETLLVICDKCHDFVKCRTLKDVWPSLLSFLDKQKNVSLCKKTDVSYQFTKAFKYQQLLLSEIGGLAAKLDVKEKELNLLVSICLTYLKPDQPELLQNAAQKMFQDLATFDPDAMWFYFNDAFSSTSCNSLHQSFNSIFFTGDMKHVVVPILNFL